MKRIFVFLVLIVFSSTTFAALINITVEGNLELTPVSPIDEGHLDGANFIVQYRADTVDDLVVNGITFSRYLVDGQMSITNRPDNFPDVNRALTFFDAFNYNLVITNRTAPDSDEMRILFATVPDFPNLQLGSLFWFGASDFWSDSELPPTLKPLINTSGFQMGIWAITDGVSSYLPTNLTISSAVIPVPPAAWLLGSALGFLGWVSRKVT